MHQRDYILRIIEQLGALLAEIRRIILGGGKPGSVNRALVDAAEQSGFDLGLLRALTVDTLYMLAAPTGEPEPARTWLMAEILYLDGLQAQLSDRAGEAHDSLLKARALYELIRPGGGMLVGFPEASERVVEIDRRLDAIAGNDPTATTGRARRRRAGAHRRTNPVAAGLPGLPALPGSAT